MRKGVYNIQTSRAYTPQPKTNTQVLEMQAIEQSRGRRRPSSALARCGSGHDEASGSPPPAHGASFRTPSFMPLIKSFLWAGNMLPGVAWRKTKSPKAGAEEASYKQEMVQEVLEAPAWKTISSRFMNSVSENVAIGKVSTAARGAGDMLEPARISQDEIPRPRPSSDPIATLNALPPRKLDAQTRSRSLPAYRHRAKAAAKEGAGARFLGWVHELRAREALAKNVASPKLHYSNYGHGMPAEKAEPPEFEPRNLLDHFLEDRGRYLLERPRGFGAGDVTEKNMKVAGEGHGVAVARG
ncbi:hypothetical protein T484DRAFT_1836625 [Baffinella frigidus]|nr:hypothetical protein T484DRAFT_1836625 [Cryptophyta sp. CCMP2293]